MKIASITGGVGYTVCIYRLYIKGLIIQYAFVTIVLQKCLWRLMRTLTIRTQQLKRRGFMQSRCSTGITSLLIFGTRRTQRLHCCMASFLSCEALSAAEGSLFTYSNQQGFRPFQSCRRSRGKEKNGVGVYAPSNMRPPHLLWGWATFPTHPHTLFWDGQHWLRRATN